MIVWRRGWDSHTASQFPTKKGFSHTVAMTWCTIHLYLDHAKIHQEVVSGKFIFGIGLDFPNRPLKYSALLKRLDFLRNASALHGSLGDGPLLQCRFDSLL